MTATKQKSLRPVVMTMRYSTLARDAVGWRLARMHAFAEYRAKLNQPYFLAHLEKLLARTPGMSERLASTRERFRALAARSS